ncbi:response regulator [Acidovorax sp. SUPP1855]|uniref:hybrid sensor histidine kinase/response regulator n=1 Tax=Acidovorax sp. SUPP1855 TaxID=431774 RepID=UPI0023DE4734|nr:ATP-binding protein [Acidovorax sp. SUPP1855]GKS86897.1 response regulator [Acidovorax sp. SUPP1855]
MRTVPLKTQLLLVAAAAILPLAVVCGISLSALFESQRAQNEASSLGVARALATAVEGELRLTMSALQTLALADPLGTADGEGKAQALALSRAVRASHPEWRGLLLADPSGRVVFSTETDRPTSANVVERSSFDATVQTRRPVAGSMARGAGGNLAFPVRVPVVRDGVVKYVLTAIIRPEAIAAVLRAQRVPEGWYVSVFDAKLARIARTVDDEKWRGSGPSESLKPFFQALGHDKQELLGTSTNVDGVLAKTVLARLDEGGWTLVLGTSLSKAESSWWRTAGAYVLGLLASLILGGTGAWWMSKSITMPMRSLRDDADALGRGELRPSGMSRIMEIDAVARALESAAVQRAGSEAEREELLQLESHARSAAQAAEQRLGLLVNASAVLSGSLEESDTLDAIARLVVPAIGDACRIDLLDEQGALLPRLSHSKWSEHSGMLAEQDSMPAHSAETPQVLITALKTGKPSLHPSGQTGEDDGRSKDISALVPEFEAVAACVVPLIARGRTIGTMAVLQAGPSRIFGAEDSALIGELAQRAALALDNALLLSEARKAQREAESANRAKDEFLAMLGHELRNPLAPIVLALQLIARRDPTAFSREREIIGRQVKHLSRLVDDLLDISRIVSGKITLALEPVDLQEVVERALELTMPALQARSSMPQLTLPNGPVLVQGELLRLVQIVCNLLNNAAKFSPPETPIRIELASETGWAVLRVSDEGVGIPAHLLHHVFERFVQGEQALERASGGLGLGLAIARSLTGLHSGTIEAHSDGPGRGSTFTLRLPLLGQRQATDDPQGDAGSEALPALRLLLVDDNNDAADLLAEWMRMEGHRVQATYSAAEGLAQLAKARFDAAIFDIGLPEISGYELARRVRSQPDTRHLPLIALTGYGSDADRLLALEAGFDDHFSKPVDMGRLLERLKALLAARHEKDAALHPRP